MSVKGRLRATDGLGSGFRKRKGYARDWEGSPGRLSSNRDWQGEPVLGQEQLALWET